MAYKGRSCRYEVAARNGRGKVCDKLVLTHEDRIWLACRVDMFSTVCAQQAVTTSSGIYNTTLLYSFAVEIVRILPVPSKSIVKKNPGTLLRMMQSEVPFKRGLDWSLRLKALACKSQGSPPLFETFFRGPYGLSYGRRPFTEACLTEPGRLHRNATASAQLQKEKAHIHSSYRTCKNEQLPRQPLQAMDAVGIEPTTTHISDQSMRSEYHTPRPCAHIQGEEIWSSIYPRARFGA